MLEEQQYIADVPAPAFFDKSSLEIERRVVRDPAKPTDFDRTRD
jgi:hypothetical protein